MNLNEIIVNSIQSVNQDLKIDALQNPTDETQLFSLLDSLGTLDLILELESRLQEITGRYIAVANEDSMDKDATPFKNIKTLRIYLQQRIENE